jgi:hypothetical protein
VGRGRVTVPSAAEGRQLVHRRRGLGCPREASV